MEQFLEIEFMSRLKLLYISIKRQKIVFTLVLLSVQGVICKNFHLLITFLLSIVFRMFQNLKHIFLPRLHLYNIVLILTQLFK